MLISGYIPDTVTHHFFEVCLSKVHEVRGVEGEEVIRLNTTDDEMRVSKGNVCSLNHKNAFQSTRCA